MKILKAFEKIDYTLDEVITLIKKGKFPYLALVYNELYDFTGNIGCVYPYGEEGYFINSNLQQCINVEAKDGFLFAEIVPFERQRK